MTPWQLTDGGERYVSSSRHAADVQTAVRECLIPQASRLSPLPAGADEPESHPTHRVAPDPAVIDTDTDSRYGHGVTSHPVESDRATRPAQGLEGAASEGSSQASQAASSSWSEVDRQAWLRRVQAER